MASGGMEESGDASAPPLYPSARSIVNARVDDSPRCHTLTSIRPQRTRSAGGVPGAEAAADEARVEAALDERLRHVAPDVEAVGAVHGHRLVRPQLGDPLLDAIRIMPRRAR